MAKREIVGVRAVFDNGNSRSMVGLAPAHARRQYAFWLGRSDVVDCALIYKENA